MTTYLPRCVVFLFHIAMRNSANVKYCDKLLTSWEGKKKSLALLLKLKAMNEGGIYYNFTYPDLSEKINVSTSSLRKYLPFLVQRGYAKFQDTHLFIQSFDNICITTLGYAPYKSVVRLPIKKEDSLIDISSLLDKSFLQEEIRRQQWCREQKESLTQCKNLHELKVAKRRVNKFRDAQSFPIVITVRTFSKKIKMSTAYVSRMLRQLQSEGVIQLSPIREMLIKGVSSDILEHYEGFKGHVYVQRGILYAHYGSEVVQRKPIVAL